MSLFVGAALSGVFGFQKSPTMKRHAKSDRSGEFWPNADIGERSMVCVGSEWQPDAGAPGPERGITADAAEFSAKGNGRPVGEVDVEAPVARADQAENERTDQPSDHGNCA